MPYEKRQEHTGLYTIINTDTETAQESRLTEQAAEVKVSLLNAVERNPEYTPSSTPTRRHPSA